MSGGYGTPIPKGDNSGNTTDPNGNPTGTPPSAPPPAGVTAPTSTYKASSPYTSPTFASTPYTGYAGLAQQLYGALNPTLTQYAAPRTGLTDMAYAPWQQLWQPQGSSPLPGSLPGNPPGVPAPGVPPSGTGTTPNLPPASGGGTRPPGGTGEPTPPPGNSVPGGYPGGGVPKSFPGAPGGNWAMQPRGNFEMGLPNTGPEGADLGSVLFPNGPPQKFQHGGAGADVPGGGLLNQGGNWAMQPRGNFEMGLPNTGPGGMDLGRALFPTGYRGANKGANKRG